MTNASSPPQALAERHDGLVLHGLDGTNPLGFLAAIGTLEIAGYSNANRDIKMSWQSDATTWRPAIHGYDGDAILLSREIARHLQCPYTPASGSEERHEVALNQFEAARKRIRDGEKQLKDQKLRGKDRIAAYEERIEPLLSEMMRLRDEWLRALEDCVPSPELSLGKHLNASVTEFRNVCDRAVRNAGAKTREIVDLLAAFGSDACAARNGDQMEATPFCFITGSGHQYFLDTVRQLSSCLDETRFLQVLTQDSNPRDDKLSMRWDPIEDRRYALMWDDPGPLGVKTNWALNLLAYRGLAAFPSVPTSRGLGTTGWSIGRTPRLTFPIWEGRLSTLVIRSLLSSSFLALDAPDKSLLSSAGIRAVYRATRIQVGNPPLHKVNFTPAQCIA